MPPSRNPSIKGPAKSNQKTPIDPTPQNAWNNMLEKVPV